MCEDARSASNKADAVDSNQRWPLDPHRFGHANPPTGACLCHILFTIRHGELWGKQKQNLYLVLLIFELFSLWFNYLYPTLGLIIIWACLKLYPRVKKELTEMFTWRHQGIRWRHHSCVVKSSNLPVTSSKHNMTS